MKRSILGLVLILLFVISSCKKDDNSIDPINADYTDETVEESKTNVENNAISLLDKVEDLEQATAIEVLMHMVELPPPTELKSTSSGTVLKPLAMLQSINNENVTPSGIFSMMKSTAEAYEDPVSFMQIWDSLVGKYTYNFQTGEYDETPLADKIVIEFPGKEGDITNTASITVDNFGVFKITDPIADWPEDIAPELPSSISVDLKYNNISIAGFSFSGSYQSDGMPTRITSTMTLDDFSFVLDITHSPYTEASIRETFKYQEQILIEIYAKANGNWSEDNIEANADDGDFQEIINNANAHFIFMNIEVAGKVNIKALADKMMALDEQYDNELITDEAYTDASVAAINDNVDLVVVYLNENKKIAEVEAYKYIDSWTYMGTTYYDYWIDMRMVYNDSSKVDMETYFNNELNNFYDELNDFIAHLNDKYDMGIDPIEPSN